MTMTRRERREWRIILWVGVASAVVSAYFGMSVRTPGSSVIEAALRGIATSLMIATTISFVELKGARSTVMRRLRRQPLAVYFAAKVLFYLAVILVGLILGRSAFNSDVEGIEFDSVFRRSIVFAVIMSVSANLVFEMGDLLGFGTLKNLLTGRYVQPRSEDRAFLLIDMKDSTGLAERLGSIRFHELLNDFFRDLADAALECESEIHKYVGDEAILTWRGDEALARGACLECPFIARDLMEKRRHEYLAKYGETPTFRAAVHFGEIVAGEIGDVRREIAYVGDTLNVAARLLEAAKTLGRDVLVSTDLLERTQVPADLCTEKLPTLTIRGRAAPLGVAALSRA